MHQCSGEASEAPILLSMRLWEVDYHEISIGPHEFP